MDSECKKCPRCDEVAYRKLGNQWLCKKHIRFSGMVAVAGRRGVVVPTQDQLHSLFNTLDVMKCPHCKITMNWMRSEGANTVITLQHYRDGSLGLICHSCNVRHAFMPEDEFRSMLPGKKWCSKCRKIRDLCEFSTDNSRRNFMNARGYCKECCNAKLRKLVHKRQLLKASRIDQVNKMIAMGMMHKDIAAELGLCNSAISNIIARNNLRKKHDV